MILMTSSRWSSAMLVAEQDVLALLRLAQVVFRAAAHHFDAVLDEKLQQFKQAQLARLAVDDGQHDHAERFLQLRMLVEIDSESLPAARRA